MTGFAQSLITIALFILILGVLVVIHEIGHFVSARMANVRVLEFGIGFPPRAKVLRNRGETLYTLNWLPIGGFVKLEGEDGDSADDPRSFAVQPWHTKMLILVAGVLVLAGVLCGVAGSYLSTAHNAGFIRDMTAGKGYLALAALIFGKWKPVPTLLACLLFAFADAVQIRLQGVPVPGIGVIPVQLIQALPYLLTVFLLAGFVGKSIAPKASGIPYLKER